MPHTSCISNSTPRTLESDLQALSERLRSNAAFADELYCALCNTVWRHADGTEWHGTWRYSSGLVAELRGERENYLSFYYSKSRAEGTISPSVAEAMHELGWSGTPRGA